MNAFIDNGYTYNPEFRQYSKYVPSPDWVIQEAKETVAHQNNYNGKTRYYGAQRIGTSRTARAHDGKMVFRASGKYLLNYPNGKSITFFCPTEIDIIRRTKTGAILHTNRTQKGKWFSNYHIAKAFFEDKELDLAIQSGIVPESVRELDDEDKDKVIFPLSPVTDGRYRFENGMLAMGNPRILTEYLFGKSRYRKDLMKSIGHSMGELGDLSKAIIATAFKGLVPIDWIIGWLRAPFVQLRFNGQFDTTYLKPAVLRKILLYLPPANYRRLLRDNESSIQEVFDIVRMASAPSNNIENLAITDVRSFNDLHDKMSAQLYPIRRNEWNARRGGNNYAAQAEIERAEREPFNHKALPGIDMTYLDSQYKYTLPENPAELRAWGQEASNCIGSYASAQRSESSLLLAVRKDDKMVACMELKKGHLDTKYTTGYKLSQLLGKYNQTLTDDVRTAIVSDLEKVGVDTSGSYWGSGR